MHPAVAFRELRHERLSALVAERGLAVIFVAGDIGPLAGHALVLMNQDRLRFHLSAQNALNAPLAAGARALAVVTGPDAYVSPDWYAAANQVPTWNYVSAELEGPVRVMNRAEAATLLDDLASHFEARLAPKPPWTRAKMEPARFEAMLGGIVAYEMRLERIAGTTKLSQNKPPDEIARVAAGLAARDDAGSQAIARLMGA
jgi:transcriptional regulator